jgi:hypothetical protein
MIWRNSFTNCAPIKFSGGLSNVTRQQAGETCVSRICGLFAVALGVVFIVAFIGVSYGT